MRVKVSDYVAEKLVEAGISQVFTVTGGGAMHLNDALGHQEGLHCLYNHHEQACAIAAESYARIHNQIAAVCVTTGPGGTNAITGVVGGWLDLDPHVDSVPDRCVTIQLPDGPAWGFGPWAIRNLTFVKQFPV